MKSNPCIRGKCSRGCFDITEEKRVSLYNLYWALDAQSRRDWLVECSQTVPVKRRRTASLVSRRTLTYEYYINYGEKDNIKVCQKFLLNTLGITQRFLLYTLSKSTGITVSKPGKHLKKKKYKIKQRRASFFIYLPKQNKLFFSSP